ncbi:MAG: PA2778 family cysteine peptidase, partial [Alphaproteobacteria bacterium]
MKRQNFLAICLAVVLVLGAVSLSPLNAATTESQLPQQVELTNVPFFAQEDYQCGPAALAMALGWSGISIRPEALVEQVYSPARKGSLPSDMITAARRQGRVAYPVDGFDNLLREVAAGHPVIVLQDLGTSLGAYWHFAVVTGYDR